MTVLTEFTKRAQRVEYVLCIEGVGFPVDESTLSSGFKGDVFTTADLDSDLATQLGAGSTVHKTLKLKGSTSSNIDPRTGAYSTSGIEVEIIETAADLVLGKFAAHQTPTSTTLNGAIEWNDTTIVLTDGSSFSEGDIAWIGGREAVLLGTKSTHTFTGSTRGYLGTPRGRYDSTLFGGSGLGWVTGTFVEDMNRFWVDRRMILYLHIPGESAGNLLVAWHGRLASLRSDIGGTIYSLSGVADVMSGVDTVKDNPSVQIKSNSFHYISGDGPAQNFGTIEFDEEGNQAEVSIFGIDSVRRKVELDLSDHYNDELTDAQRYAPIKAAYQYRTEPGGTDGLFATGWEDSGIQAYTAGGTHVMAATLMATGNGQFFRLIKHHPDGGSFKFFQAEVTADWAGQWNLKIFEEGTPVKLCLDNWINDTNISRFVVNGSLRRNPVDVLLMFLTSMPNEFQRMDTAATTHTTTAVEFAASTFGTADQYAGAALHCVEGDNKGLARIIDTHDTDTVTVESPFVSTPSASGGEEYQIRNSIYDVLPLGWGLGIPHWRIDIGSFEDVRDDYLATAKLGKFALGTQDRMDLWEFLRKNICEPYGILVHIDRTTGKIRATHLGDPVGDGIDVDYTTVAQSQIVKLGDLNYNLAKPVGGIDLTVRDSHKAILDYSYSPGPGYNTAALRGDVSSPDPTGGATHTIPVTTEIFDGAFLRSDLHRIGYSALLNTVADVDGLIDIVLRRLIRGAVPNITCTAELDIALFPSVKEGSFLKISFADAPPNPFTGSRGWSNVVARVLSLDLPLASGKAVMRVGLELLGALNGSKIAPAAVITGSGEDGDGWYVDVEDYNFVRRITSKAGYDISLGDKDWFYFAVDDAVEIRDSTGAFQETVGDIVAFGSNLASDPKDAASSRIYVDGPVTAVSTGDYLTFTAWAAAQPARMDDFAAYADTNETLGSSNDPAKDL